VVPSLFILMTPIPGLNKDVLDRIIKELGLQSLAEKLPLDLMTTIQPVLISNPERIVNVTRAIFKVTSGASTIFTTPTDRDFFLTYATLNVMADATADSTEYGMDIELASGLGENVIEMNKLSLTAFQNSEGITFNPPVKLSRGSPIRIVQSFSVGASVIGGYIGGYTVDIL